MRSIRSLFLRSLALFAKSRRHKEFDEELKSHLNMHVEDGMRSGMTRKEAERSALLKLGGVDSTSERYRDQAGIPFVEGLVRDARIASRMLRKSPGFTTIVVLTLSLGIGANTAIFSVVNSVLLKPLPYPHPEQLVNVWRTQGKGWTGSVSIPDLKDWQEQNTAFVGISAFSRTRFALRLATEPETAEGADVSPNFFDVMQLKPIVGRGFEAGEDREGRNHVVVLGYRLWLDRFGGDRKLTGRNITLNGQSYTVIGVMPKGFQYPGYFYRTDLWVPLAPSTDQLRRDAHDFLTIARLRPGITIDHAEAQLNSISGRLAQQYPETDKGLGALLVPLRKTETGGVEQSLIAMLAVVRLIFLIACANVSTLLLSRAAARRREIALRIALGASRMRMVQQFFIESVLLALTGALLAALTARWLLASIVALAGRYLPDPSSINPDNLVFGLTMALALLAAILLSLTAAWATSGVDINEVLKEGAGSIAGGGRRSRSQRLLVIVQLGAAFTLLIGAGAMVESMVRLSRVPTGFDPEHVLTMRLLLSSPEYSDHPASVSLEPVLSKIEALPGIESAAVITYLPMQSYGTTSDFSIAGKPVDSTSDKPWAEVRAVSPDYYRAMGIGLLNGRWFTRADGPDSPFVVVVNRTFLNRYFPEGHALGQEISLVDEHRWATIVGIVEDSRQAGLDSQARPEVDIPYSQNSWKFLTSAMSLVARTEGDATAMSRAIRQAIYSVDPDQPIYGVSSVASVIAESQADRRFVAWLLGLFAGLALTLSAIGLFGLMSYSVSRRAHEIGVRVALGAGRRAVLGLIAAECAKQLAVGLVTGLAGSFWLMRLLAGSLYGVRPADPLAIGSATILLIAVAFAACCIPARRAMSVDPNVALRYE